MAKRISKDPEERKAEIIDTAFRLFKEKGYADTSVSQIVKKIGIAQGTFYYHFESKKEVLYHIMYHRFINTLIDSVKPVIIESGISALEKLQKIANIECEVSILNLPEIGKIENADLFRRISRETVRHYIPLVADVVKQGVKEGDFNVQYPLQVCSMFHVSNLFFFHPGVFLWRDDEFEDHLNATVNIMEKGYGAKPGTLAFYYDILKRIQTELRG